MTGQTDSNEPASSIEDEQQLRRMNEEWVEALIQRDTGALDRLMAGDCIFTDALAGDDKAQFIGDIETGELQVDTLNRENVEVRIYGSTGVLMALDTARWKYKDHNIEGHYRIMHVYAKRDGNWQIVAIQASPIAMK